MRFNPPPGWPTPPEGWTPPPGWVPDPSWPRPPHGWQLWLPGPTVTSLGTGDDLLIRSEPGVQEFSLEGASMSSGSETSEMPVDSAALMARITELEKALAATQAGSREIIELSDQRALQDVGIYRYHHPLENAAAYKGRLEEIDTHIAEFVKSGTAILAADLFTFNGSLAKGRRLVADLSKLMLLAYNAEAANCVRSLRAGNITTAKKRLERTVASIEKLGAIMEMRINPDYHSLRIAELELTADFRMKIQEERQRERERRAQLAEERKAQEELATEKERLKKERAHYASALETLRAQGDDAAADELAGRLADIDQAIEKSDYRIANIRAGYVYVISNIGVFGPHVVKIGLTRRLDPMDRVRELGDASVPFRYDVHALYFSKDAVTLENELHQAFADRRVNFANPRREFFFATPSEVRNVLLEKTEGGLLQFTEEPEALEYLQSLRYWPDHAQLPTTASRATGT
ncbi:DUF4041 domain-containing protein [Frankia sp. B2]|nr:DUF4041 domain-containing protein [Frankia sp. B2]